MEDKLNIAEILEDAPTGTLLYSPIFGELAYIGSYANEGQTYSIITCQYPDAIGQGDSVSVEFDENGTYLNHGYSSRRGGEWYDSVLYSDANGQYVRELNDFNIKFRKI